MYLCHLHARRLIPADLQYEEGNILDSLRRGERIDHIETERLKKGGGVVNISLSISPMKGPRRPCSVAHNGWGQDNDRRKARTAGFDQDVVKPIGREKLMGILHTVAQRPATFTPSGR